MSEKLAVGQLVGERYELRAVVAEAPAYTEYRAFDREVEVEVSLWWFRDELFPTDDQRSQLVTAAYDMRSIGHQNLRKLFDVGRTDDGMFATVQMCPGVLLRPGQDPPASEDNILRIATAVSDGLEAGRAAGHVHGRLTPRDIVHVAGLIKVGGVGLYRAVDRDAAAALWLGDEHYVAPEVRSGGAPTAAADVYSLAVILAEVAAGMTSPDLGHTMQTVAEQQPGMQTVLDAALSSRVEQRPQTCAVMLEMLHALSSEPTAQDSREHAIPTMERLAGEEPHDGDEDPTTALDVIASMVPVADDGAITPPPPSPSAPRQRAETRSLLGPRGKRNPGDFLESIAAETVAHDGPISGAPPPPRPSTSPPTPIGVPPPPPPPPLAGVGHPGRRSAPVEVIVPSADATPETVVDAGSDGQLQFVSMKPPSEQGTNKKTPIVPVIERQKPKLRPIGDIRPDSAKPKQLGYYAPPRAPVTAARPKRNLTWLYIILAAFVVSGGVVVAALMLRDSGGGAAREATGKGVDAAPVPVDDKTPVPVVAITPIDAGEPSPCPSPGMVMWGDACIDAYESPGKGRLPETGVSVGQAEASCNKRGLRLCSEKEWVAACRGPHRASFPYGESSRPAACNTFKGSTGEVAPTGSHPDCKSASGAFDMAGNVAEWVAGGQVMGGSVQDGHSGRCSKRTRRRTSDRTYSDVGFRCCGDAAPAP